jgi:hypothetical protein
MTQTRRRNAQARLVCVVAELSSRGVTVSPFEASLTPKRSAPLHEKSNDGCLRFRHSPAQCGAAISRCGAGRKGILARRWLACALGYKMTAMKDPWNAVAELSRRDERGHQGLC